MGGVIHKATNGHNRRHIGEEMEGDMRRSCTKRIASIYFRQARIPGTLAWERKAICRGTLKKIEDASSL